MTRLFALLSVLLFALPARADCGHLRDLAMRAESSDAAYALAIGQWGLCAEKDSRHAEAHRLVSRALEASPPETTTAGKAAPWPALRAALRRLDDRVARVLVTFDGDLFVDGHAVVAVSGAVLAVDPGRHLFEQRGKTHAAKEVEARAGDLPTVDLRRSAPPVEPSKQAVSVPTPPRSAPGPFAPALTPRGIAVSVTYGALGVSLAAGIAAGILETQRAAAAAGSPLDACLHGGDDCAKIRLAFDQSRGARSVAIGAGVVAVIAGGVAVTLHLTGNKADVAVGGSW